MNFRYRFRPGIRGRISWIFAMLGWAVSSLFTACTAGRTVMDVPRPDWNPEVLVFDNGRFRLEWPDTLSGTVLTWNFNLRGGSRELSLSTGPWGPGIPLSAGVTAGGFPGVGKGGEMESALGPCPVSRIPFGTRFFGDVLSFDRTFAALPFGQDTRIDLSWTLDGEEATARDKALLASILASARRVGPGEDLKDRQTAGVGNRDLVYAGLGLVLPQDMIAYGGMEMLSFTGETDNQIILVADTAPLGRSLEEEAAERLYLPDLEYLPPLRVLASQTRDLAGDASPLPVRETLHELSYRRITEEPEPAGPGETVDSTTAGDTSDASKSAGPARADRPGEAASATSPETAAATAPGTATVLVWQLESLDPGRVFCLRLITRGDLIDPAWFKSFCDKVRTGIRVHDPLEGDTNG